MIYASFCFNNPQNVLGSRGSACTARSDTQLIVGSCNVQSSSRARIDRARRLYTGCGNVDDGREAEAARGADSWFCTDGTDTLLRL